MKTAGSRFGEEDDGVCHQRHLGEAVFVLLAIETYLCMDALFRQTNSHVKAYWLDAFGALRIGAVYGQDWLV